MSQVPEDEPLDPKVEAIRRKMVRLLAVSGGIMVIGLMTVLAAIVYRVNRDAPDASPTMAADVALPAKAEIALPEGARVLHTALDGSRVMLTVQLPDGNRAILIHAASGERLSRIDLR